MEISIPHVKQHAIHFPLLENSFKSGDQALLLHNRFCLSDFLWQVGANVSFSYVEVDLPHVLLSPLLQYLLGDSVRLIVLRFGVHVEILCVTNEGALHSEDDGAADLVEAVAAGEGGHEGRPLVLDLPDHFVVESRAVRLQVFCKHLALGLRAYLGEVDGVALAGDDD